MDEVSSEPGRQRALARIRTFVRVWDEAIELPIIGRVGLDALVGLIPGAGDLIGALVALYPPIEAARLGAGSAVLGRMVLNIGIDALIGAVPLLGDLFDIGWKANRRNHDLLVRWLASPRAVRRTSALTLGGVVVASLGVISLVGWMLVAAVRAVLP